MNINDDEIRLCEEYNSELNQKMENISKSIEHKYLCNKCHGSGRKYISPCEDYQGIDRKCYECNGSGYTKKLQHIIIKNINCINCNGLGKVKEYFQAVYYGEPSYYSDVNCKFCKGSGIMQEKEFI